MPTLHRSSIEYLDLQALGCILHSFKGFISDLTMGAEGKILPMPVTRGTAHHPLHADTDKCHSLLLARLDPELCSSTTPHSPATSCSMYGRSQSRRGVQCP